MKKIWLVLLSLGLIMAFSVSAFAVDVKVSAEYFVGGLYLNKVTLDDGFEGRPGDRGSVQPSTAFFYQRLRVGTDFVVSPCLKLVTRFTAMDRIWGGERSSSGYGGYGGSGGLWPDNTVTQNTGGTAGTRAESENIALDLVYIDYTSPIGLFRVGYQPDYVWGTAFGDRANGMPAGQIMYAVPIGPFTFMLDYAKEQDNSFSAVNNNTASAYRTDRDSDSYRIAGIYNFKGGETGALFLWNRDASHRGWGMTDTFPFYAEVPYLSNIFAIDPYVKAKIGPVTLQAEAQYWFGNAVKYEYSLGGSPTPLPPYTMNDISVSAISVFLDATANFGMFYAGGSFAYLSGDDPSTKDKVEGSGTAGIVNSAGLDWNPCLIMFNTDLNYWAGNIAGHTDTVLNGEMSNAWFGQLRGGVKPTPQLDVMLAVSYAAADKKLAYYTTKLGFYGPYITNPGSNYGTEIDVTATYKITNNLSYMLGAGYLFTGDYFKGVDDFPNWGGAKVNDDYMLINKLTLSF